MPITNEALWKSWIEHNQDPYGGAIVAVAREAMRLLDERPGPINPHRLINDADEAANMGGITGFMAGCVTRIISECHSRGDEFRVVWNRLFEVPDHVKGVVNPAIVTIKTGNE